MHDGAHAQALENTGQAIAWSDGYDADALRGLGRGGCRQLALNDEILILGLHVFHHDVAQRAQAGPVTDRDARVVHVDVYFDRRRVAHDERTFAHFYDFLADGVHIEALSNDEELHVVAVADLAGLQSRTDKIDGLGQPHVLGDGFPAHVAQHSFQNDE